VGGLKCWVVLSSLANVQDPLEQLLTCKQGMSVLIRVQLGRRLRLCAILIPAALLATGSVFGQPSVPSKGSATAYYLVVRCEQDGATCYRSGPSDGGNWLSLGKVNVPIIINPDIPASGRIAIGGELVGGQVAPFCGYQSAEREVVFHPAQGKAGQAEYEGAQLSPVHYFPDFNQDPIELRPEAGSVASLLRWKFWAFNHWLSILAFFVTLLAMLMAVISRRPQIEAAQLRRRRERQLLEKFSDFDPDADVYLNRCFSNWRTVERLGQGGMAVVYRAVPEETLEPDQAVALKVMNADIARDDEYRRRFLREIEICQSLEHPNVVRPIDWGEQSGILFLVMELVEGKPLRDLLPSGGYQMAEGLQICNSICSALIYAHSKGVVHRDLKPENVMITHKGLVKVMDLGLAKRTESENVTKTGDTFGTPAYMSPEQIAGGGGLMAATDQYAFGIMVFELLCGRRPFIADEPLNVILQHLNDTPPRLRHHCRKASMELEEMVATMLSKDPSLRYKHLSSVAEILEREMQRLQPKARGNIKS
jgi:predicted Ser/Thr protein kinase